MHLGAVGMSVGYIFLGLLFVGVGVFTLLARDLQWRWYLEAGVRKEDRAGVRPSEGWEAFRLVRGWGAVLIGGLIVLYNLAAWLLG